MRGFITHVSDPKTITARTTALEKIPETLRLSPSRPRIFVTRVQLFRAIFSYLTTVGHSLQVADETRPRYLKEVTISSGLP